MALIIQYTFDPTAAHYTPPPEFDNEKWAAAGYDVIQLPRRVPEKYCEKTFEIRNCDPNFNGGEPLLYGTGSVRWDICTNWTIAMPLHFCIPEQAAQFGQLLAEIQTYAQEQFEYENLLSMLTQDQDQ